MFSKVNLITTAEYIVFKPVLVRKLYALDFCYVKKQCFMFLFIHDINS